jgi:hypothetical protein
MNTSTLSALSIKTSKLNGLDKFDNDAAKKGIAKAVERLSGANVEIYGYAAIGFWNLIAHGDSFILNTLYRSLANNNVTAKDAAIMRSVYANAIIDRFGRGGKTDAGTSRMFNDKGDLIATKWIERPTAIFRFVAKPADGGQGGFEIVKTSKPDGTLPNGMSEKDVENIRAAKKAIRNAGIEALASIPWVTAKQESNNVKLYDEAWLKKTVKAFLTTGSKFAFANHLTDADISTIGRIAKLDATEIKTIQDARRTEKPVKAEAMPETETLADLENTIDGETVDAESHDPAEVAANAPPAAQHDVHVN